MVRKQWIDLGMRGILEVREVPSVSVWSFYGYGACAVVRGGLGMPLDMSLLSLLYTIYSYGAMEFLHPIMMILSITSMTVLDG